jgi:hypothetical protein
MNDPMFRNLIVARLELLCSAFEQLPDGYEPDEAEQALVDRLIMLLGPRLRRRAFFSLQPHEIDPESPEVPDPGSVDI